MAPELPIALMHRVIIAAVVAPPSTAPRKRAGTERKMVRVDHCSTSGARTDLSRDKGTDAQRAGQITDGVGLRSRAGCCRRGSRGDGAGASARRRAAAAARMVPSESVVGGP